MHAIILWTTPPNSSCPAIWQVPDLLRDLAAFEKANLGSKDKCGKSGKRHRSEVDIDERGTKTKAKSKKAPVGRMTVLNDPAFDSSTEGSDDGVVHLDVSLKRSTHDGHGLLEAPDDGLEDSDAESDGGDFD